MEGQSPFDISVWKYEHPSTQRSSLPKERRFFPPSLIGFCGALIAHALLVQSISSYSSAPSVAKRQSQLQVESRRDERDERGDLLLVDLPPSTRVSNDAIENIVSTRLVISTIRPAPARLADLLPILDAYSLALGDERHPQENDADGEMSEKARWTNIYSGQIQARITRAWRRPRSPVEVGDGSAATSFQCEAQIVQDATGNVQEILLPNCNGTPAWQQSLVTAIRQASPLPAPPDASVFARSMTLNFVGLPYTSGESEDDYEIDKNALAEMH